jgi:hypothetical protein
MPPIFFLRNCNDNYTEIYINHDYVNYIIAIMSQSFLHYQHKVWSTKKHFAEAFLYKVNMSAYSDDWLPSVPPSRCQATKLSVRISGNSAQNSSQ